MGRAFSSSSVRIRRGRDGEEGVNTDVDGGDRELGSTFLGGLKGLLVLR